MKKQVMTKGQAGFSLVELMVVVAIIGVLAMMAVPRVNSFIAKSRQSEAKVNLSSFYTFNKNFYVEFQGYTNSFEAMGFSPEGQLRYNVGIGGGADANSQYRNLKGDPGGTTDTLTRCPVIDGKVGNDVECFTMNGANGEAPPAVEGEIDTGTFGTFTAQARAVLISNAGTADGGDLWTINQAKNLLNADDGTVEASE